jgi:hypothetical protein
MSSIVDQRNKSNLKGLIYSFIKIIDTDGSHVNVG